MKIPIDIKQGKICKPTAVQSYYYIDKSRSAKVARQKSLGKSRRAKVARQKSQVFKSFQSKDQSDLKKEEKATALFC